MAQQTINIGTVANDGTGDPLRTAFDKVNDNFTELYSDDAGDVNSVNGQTGTVVLDSDDISEGATNEYLLADSVTYAKLGDEYTTVSLPTTAATMDIDFSSAQVFQFTSSISTELTFTNADVGMVKDIRIIESGGTSALTFSQPTSIISGEYDNTALSNFIQVIALTSSLFYVSITQPTAA